MEACEHIISEMGAELHDDLIQKLSIFRLYLDRLERSKSDPSEIESLLLKMNVDYQEVVQSVRRISRRMLPVKMEGDSFQSGINLLCQNMERPGGSTIHFHPQGKEQHLTELYLYRIIQELVHNALRHSSAWHVWVRLIWTERRLLIEVEDDGTAFSNIPEFISSLRKKHNTLRMRSHVIGAGIEYLQGSKGLLARVTYDY
jgi:signal transduction histidine kinase